MVIELITKIKNKLSYKVFIITSAILIITTVITFLFFLFIASKTYLNALDSELDQQTKLFLKEVQTSTYDTSGAIFDRYLNQNNVVLELYDISYYLIDIPTQMNSFEDNDTFSYEGSMASENIEDDTPNDPYLFQTATKKYEFTFADSDKNYFLEVTGTRQNFSEVINSVTTVLPYWIIIVLIISILASWFYSLFITKPIKQISKASVNMANLIFDSKCEIQRGDEIGVLAENLNTLSNNLSSTLVELKQKNEMLLDDIQRERKLEKKRMEFFSSISHELKTPITVLQGQLAGMIQNIGVYADREKYLRKSLNVLFDMKKMVQEILTISRMSSSDVAISLTDTNLSELVNVICYKLEDTAALKDLSLITEIEPEIFLPLDTSIISKVLSNIILNGLTYSVKESNVYVKLSAQSEYILFTCLNQNSYIPEESLSNIFDAFYRVESSRNKETGGTGLGLYIVKTGLELHHAAYNICNTETGVLFTVKFPLK